MEQADELNRQMNADRHIKNKQKAGRQKDFGPEGVTHNEEAIMRPERGGEPIPNIAISNTYISGKASYMYM